MPELLDRLAREVARWSIVYVSNNTLEPWLQKGLVSAIRSIFAGEDVSPLAAPQTVACARETYADRVGAWVTSANVSPSNARTITGAPMEESQLPDGAD